MISPFIHTPTDIVKHVTWSRTDVLRRGVTEICSVMRLVTWSIGVKSVAGWATFFLLFSFSLFP